MQISPASLFLDELQKGEMLTYLSYCRLQLAFTIAYKNHGILIIFDPQALERCVMTGHRANGVRDQETVHCRSTVPLTVNIHV